MVQKVRQRIFARSGQINNDAADGEEDAVFPAAVRFAGVIPAILEMYGTGTEGDCTQKWSNQPGSNAENKQYSARPFNDGSWWREPAGNHVDVPHRVRFEYFHGMFDSKGEYLQVAVGNKRDAQ